jgi:glycosyltransferase involved in cell wall biosynthesis
MPRVVLIGPRPGARGGIAQFVDHLSRALEPQADVRRIAFARLYPAWTAAGRNESVDPSAEASLLAWRPSTWRTTARRITALRPDLVVVQWWHPAFGPCLRFLARAARACGARVVFVCHNAQPHERFPLGTWLTRSALSWADGLVALSESTAGELRAMLPGTPLDVEPHPAYAFPVTAASRARWRARAGGGPVVLFFGYVRPYKGLEDLVAAMAIVCGVHPTARLLVAGPFLGSVEPYRDAARRAGVGDAVRLIPGYVPDDEVGGLLATADTVVLPYRSASQSGVAPQAIAAGIPVVATDVGGLAEAVRGHGEIVPPGDRDALAGGILRALARPRSRPAEDSGWAAWRRLLLGAADPRSEAAA